jgi:hypothetical protein
MVRQPIPAEPRQIEQLRLRVQAQWYSPPFIFLDVHRPWRKVKVGDSRAAVDFAVCMRELTDVHFPQGGVHPSRPGQSVDALGGRALPRLCPL